MASIDKFKLSTITWDSDANPNGFYVWQENFSSMVKSTLHGAELEEFLDSKLGRNTAPTHVPSFILDDPDFDEGETITVSASQQGVAREDDNEQELESSTQVPEENQSESQAQSQAPSKAFTAMTGASHMTQFSLGRHKVPYKKLSKGARELDCILYNIYRTAIKGTKQQLCRHVKKPSYVQAVCVLDKHMGLSKFQRIMAAFNAMDTVSYTGDAGLFLTQFMAGKRELDTCNASVQHYLCCKLMRAFDGKSKTIQHKIAEDFGTMDIEKVNMYDMVQNYCAQLAAVGDSKVHPIHAVGTARPPRIPSRNGAGKYCAFCKKKDSHDESECWSCS